MGIQLSDLEIISKASIGKSLYYRVSKDYRYCGWTDRPHCLIDKKSGRHIILKGKEAASIQLCNGKIDCSLDLIPEVWKNGISILKEKGYVTRCLSLDDLSEPYVRYNNREINFLTWAVTGGCNLKCRHCFLSAPGAKYGELCTEDCLKIIDEFSSCGVTSIGITGGEPLFRRDIRTLIRYIKEKGIVLSAIATNGTLVTDSFLDFLDEIDCHPEIKMSYDGVNGWHDWLRGISGSERLLLSSYKKLSERGIKSGTSMTVHKGNINDIYDTILKMVQYGSALFKTSKVFDVGEWGEFGKDMGISDVELFEAYLQTIEKLYRSFPEGMPLNIILNRFIRIEKGQIDYRLLPVQTPCSHFGDLHACESMYRRFHVSGDGRIQPCLVMSSVEEQHNKLPRIHVDGLVACMDHPEFLNVAAVKVQDIYNHNSGCNCCKYSCYCAGGCRAMGCIEDQADYFHKDSSSCLFFKGGYMDRTISLIQKICPDAKCTNIFQQAD